MGDKFSVCFLYLVVALCHLAATLSGDGASGPHIQLSLTSVPIIFAIHQGYKRGALGGVLAGAIPGLIVLVAAMTLWPAHDEAGTEPAYGLASWLWRTSALDLHSEGGVDEFAVRLEDFSVVGMLQICFAGWLAAKGGGILRKWLAGFDLDLDALLRPNHESSGLFWLSRRLPIWFLGREEQPGNPMPAASASIARKVVMPVVAANVLVVLVLLSLSMSITFANVSMQLPPPQLGVLLTAIIAFRVGARRGVALAIGVWFLAFAIGGSLQSVGAPIYPLVSTSALPGWLVVTWLAGKFGEAFRDPALQALLSRAISLADPNASAKPQPPVVFTLLLFIAAYLVIRPIDSLTLYPMALLFLLVALGGVKFDPATVSNRVLLVGLFAGTFTWLPVSEDLLFDSGFRYVSHIVVLAIVPFVASRVDKGTVRDCRVLALATLAALLLLNGLLEGWPLLTISLSLWIGRNTDLIPLAWVWVFVEFLIAAQCLHWLGRGNNPAAIPQTV